MKLAQGESIYIDSTMPHAMISVGKKLAQILSVCTHEIEQAGESEAETVPLKVGRPRASRTG